MRSVRPLGAERAPVDAAAGRVIAEDLVAGCDMPAFDHSSMDGYAFASADFAGDGPRSPGERGPEGSIPESNGTFVAAAGTAAGAIVRVAPFVRDDLDSAVRAVRDALAGSDLLVTIGGVSVGDRDVMKTALED